MIPPGVTPSEGVAVRPGTFRFGFSLWGKLSMVCPTKSSLRVGLQVAVAVAVAAGAVLIGFGAVWPSVRGQHPYKGPTVDDYTQTLRGLLNGL